MKLLVVVVAFWGCRGVPVDADVIPEYVQADTPSRQKENNPVQEWLEHLSKDTSTNAQIAFNSLKELFTKGASNGASPNLPVMYVGSFQMVKMPQMSDIANGLGNMATAAQAINKLTALGQGLTKS